MIKHTNFQRYRIQHDGVVQETQRNDDKFINKRVRLFIHQTMPLRRVEKKKLLGRHNKDIYLEIR